MHAQVQGVGARSSGRPNRCHRGRIRHGRWSADALHAGGRLLVRRVRSFFVASEFWREPLVRSWRALGEKVVVVLPLPMARTNACDSIGVRAPHRMQYKTAQEVCAFVLVRRRKRQRRQKNFQLADRRRGGHRRHRVVLLARSACVCA